MATDVQGDSTVAMSLEFETWKPGSEKYADVDAELRAKLRVLHFFCNRPTLGALMGIGQDISAALEKPETGPSVTGASDTPAEQVSSDDETSSDESQGSFLSSQLPHYGVHSMLLIL